MTDWLLVVGVVVGVNLLPVLGPPTWLVLVLLRLHLGLPVVPLVAVGAASATAGRVLLALGTRGAAQLFEAAGLMRLALVPLAAAFLVGRTVSYSLYTGAAAAADKSYGAAFRDSLTSWPSVVLQVVLLLVLWQLSRVDWVARLSRGRVQPPPGDSRGNDAQHVPPRP